MQPPNGQGPQSAAHAPWSDALIIEAGGRERAGWFSGRKRTPPQRVEISHSQVVVYVNEAGASGGREQVRASIQSLSAPAAQKQRQGTSNWFLKLISAAVCAGVATGTLVMLAAYAPARDAEATSLTMAAALAGDWRGRCADPPMRRPIRLSIQTEGGAARLVWADFSYRLQPAPNGFTAYRGATAVGEVRFDGDQLVVEMSNFRCGRIVAERAEP